MTLLSIRNLKKVYGSHFSNTTVEALKQISFAVEDGEYIAIMGESGSGKTTLLNILAALDTPTAGEVLLNKQKLSELKDTDLATFRRNNLGFVFQDFNLLDNFNNQDNIFLPLVLSRIDYKTMQERMESIAPLLGIQSILNKFPYEISGGQKQRIAIARALITNPKLILADEPTGALDSKSSDDLLALFNTINNLGQTILMVTHSIKAAASAKRVLFIRDGEVYHQLYRMQEDYDQFYKKISDTLTLMSKGSAHD